MSAAYNVLILGASYGSLLAVKLVAAGHTAKLVCLPAEAEAFNSDGARVRMPIKGRDGLVEVHSKKLPGKLSADAPGAVNPHDYDLVVLAMQEPQYRSAGVRELLDAVAKSNVPCMSIMNMPPLPYLARIPGLSVKELRSAYTDAAVWDGFDPQLMTLCSPDPQAFRPPDEKINVLQVRLPTNFKSARFPSDAHTRILKDLEKGIEAVRYEGLELPVKLKVHESVFVPLAKWAMLMAGNYRCVTKDGMIPIKEAVHRNLEASRSVYDWVVKLCVSLGANEKDLVPFEKYAAAAQGLANPSSAARALFGGAPNIERVDRLVQAVAARKGMRNPVIDEVVTLVDARLELNRRSSQAAVSSQAGARKTA
jgi:ketopantoate reductase